MQPDFPGEASRQASCPPARAPRCGRTLAAILHHSRESSRAGIETWSWFSKMLQVDWCWSITERREIYNTCLTNGEDLGDILACRTRHLQRKNAATPRSSGAS